jgi:DNA-binding MarR family transcriptional regulator
MSESGDARRSSAVQPQEEVAFEAWSLLLRTHARLVGGLDETLRERAGLTLSAYDVLAHVAAAPDRRIPMHQLEDKVLFSQSTISRLAARLEREGLLERVVAERDRRALVVRLTGAGASTFRRAREVAAVYLREHFVGALAPGQDVALRDVLRALSAATPPRP